MLPTQGNNTHNPPAQIRPLLHQQQPLQQQQQQIPQLQQQQQQTHQLPRQSLPQQQTLGLSQPALNQPYPQLQHVQQQQQQQSAHALSQDQLKELILAAKLRQENGSNETNDPEFARIVGLLRQYSINRNLPGQSASRVTPPTALSAPQHSQQAPNNSHVSLPTHSSVPASSNTSLATTASSAATQQTAPVGPFTHEQLTALRCQIYVFKLISGNKPVPEHLRQRVFNVEHLQPEASQPDIHPIPQKIVELTQKQVQAPPQTAHTPPIVKSVATRFEMGPLSTPYSLLPKKVTLSDLQQRVIIPSGTPSGIDPYALVQERERHIKARISYRISELEQLPSNLSNDGDAKLRALIELKSLKLLEKQKKLRAEVIQSLGKATTLATAADRSSFRRVKKQSLREARQTEKLEKNQRLEREKRDKQKHQDYLMSILQHGRDMVSFHKQQQTKCVRLGQAIGRFHVNAQKEEEKRQSRVSQERLNALKANDEAAYLKLVDKAKDNRIMHLLNQTETYLGSLTKAMHDQKASVIDHDAHEADHHGGGGEDDQENDYYATAHKLTEVVTEQSSLLVGGKLKDYQIKGLQWMVSLYNNRLNGILADEMGLGKTIQTISLITYLMEKKKQNGPYLVIVPLSTITNWDLEFERWAPKVHKIVFKGIPSERARMRNEIKSGNFNVVVTTYEYIILEKSLLSKIKWVYMIIDEGHRMKNTRSKLSTTLMQHYNTRYRIILTGTPLQNNLPELWALLNFILPKIFNSVDTFDEWFNHPFAKEGGKENEVRLNEEESLLIIRGLHKVLRPFLLRRLKKDVESELPDKVETVLKCSMSALQYRLYEQIRNKKSSFGYDGQTRRKALNNLVMQFRKVCNHPYVFEEVERSLNPHGLTDDNLWRVAGKFELLDRVLPKYKASGHRILMFFQMTQVMDIMEDYLRFKSHTYLRLDGHTKAEDRTVMLKTFNSREDPPFIFLLSTRAGGLGLNLQTADTVIIFDSDWNPHQDLQAQDRAHRIGQTKEVRILRLITARSVEETILARAQYKLDMDGKVIQAGKFDNKTTDRERDELLRSLFGGEEGDEEEKDAENEGNLEDSELNEIIARNDDELELFNKMDAERHKQELLQWRALGNRGDPPPRLMEDKELPAIYLAEDDETIPEAELELGRGARVRKDVRYDDGLNDDQYLAALDTGDVEGYIERRRAMKARREDRKRLKAGGSDEEEEDDEDRGRDQVNNLGGKTLPVAAQGGKTPGRKRGRPAKKPKNDEMDGMDEGINDFGAEELPPSSRRSRKIKIREDTNEDTPAPKRGRKKRFAGVDTEEVDILRPVKRRALRRIFESCYKVVEQAEVEYDNGIRRKRCELFAQVPPKALYPDYYKLIKTPIAMDMIWHRLTHVYYKSIDQFVADFHLMFANAMQYNVEGSEVYDDATQMKKALDAEVNELAPGGQPIILPEDEVEPLDSTGGGKRKQSAGGGGSDASDFDDQDGHTPRHSVGGKGSRKRSYTTATGSADDDGGDDAPRKVKKKMKRESIPGMPSKYGALPKIRMRPSVQQPPPGADDGEDGEIFE
ncbi:hypothetical protein PhCBS80983_g04959 [Powellomyces hirtus]|uniref:Uncharacterized protein n=1 Tax=Powellomyces hirtus TaxID=109895 RepID=A0A507DXI0_9FUNG|nr:hypothetical protein PhCBS80983_g04959 [Powellomyces hirtus]